MKIESTRKTSVPLFLRDRLQRDFSQYVSCFLSCHFLDLFFQCTCNNIRQSAVRARHEIKTINYKNTFTINSFDEVTGTVALLLLSATLLNCMCVCVCGWKGGGRKGTDRAVKWGKREKGGGGGGCKSRMMKWQG